MTIADAKIKLKIDRLVKLYWLGFATVKGPQISNSEKSQIGMAQSNFSCCKTELLIGRPLASHLNNHPFLELVHKTFLLGILNKGL